jgi:uncharacterized protein (TIGR02246 family)
MRERKVFNVSSSFKLILGIVAVVSILTEKQSFADSPVLPSLAIATPTNQERLESMQPKEIQAIIEQSREAWVRGDADAIAALFSPNGEFIVPGNRWVGREAIRQIAADFFASHSDVKIEIKRIMIEGNQAFVEWSWEDREKTTGRLNQADDAIVLDFQADRISRWREYFDTETKKP